MRGGGPRGVDTQKGHWSLGGGSCKEEVTAKILVISYLNRHNALSTPNKIDHLKSWKGQGSA